MSDKKRTILLVEDNPSDEMLAREALSECGVAETLVVARDGVEAIDQLLGRTQEPLPSLVLLDLRLPRVDGLEVLKQLRAAPRTRRLPVVVLTTSSEERDVDTAYDLGCNGYVQKPLNMDEFILAIRDVKAFFLDRIVAPSEPPAAAS